MVLENEYLFGTVNAPSGVPHSPIFSLSLSYFPFTCSLTLAFICCNLNESAEKGYSILICKELLLGLKQSFNMQDEWKEEWDRGCWLSVSARAVAAIPCLLSKIHQGEVTALQTKITDGRSCLPYSRGLATVSKVQENLNNWRCSFVCALMRIWDVFFWFCLWIFINLLSNLMMNL